MNEQVFGTAEKRYRIAIDKIKDDLRRFSNRSDIQVSSKGMNNVQHNFSKNNASALPSRQSLKSVYDGLLNQKVNDEFVNKQAVRYAEVIMQPRVFCGLTLNVDKGNSPKLKVLSTLPEHGQVMANFWDGKQIDSNAFAQLVLIFKRQLAQFGVVEVLIEQHPTGHCTVQSTSYLWSMV